MTNLPELKSREIVKGLNALGFEKAGSNSDASKQGRQPLLVVRYSQAA